MILFKSVKRWKGGKVEKWKSEKVKQDQKIEVEGKLYSTTIDL
jgi:hypothetical protein